jgi:hypothetical protein
MHFAHAGIRERQLGLQDCPFRAMRAKFRFRSRQFCDNAARPAVTNVKRITRALLHLR